LSRAIATGARVLHAAACIAVTSALTCASGLAAPPRVILISLDGAKPALVDAYLKDGTLDATTGLGLLRSTGVWAQQNITAIPSLTAVSHIAIATGSTAANNNIPANTYHAVAQPISNTTSGFAGPIGGYRISPLGPSPAVTAEPLWVKLRAAGKKIVTATWPGADGVDVTLAGTAGTPIVQSAVPTRTVDYTVPFGTFGGVGAQGFKKSAADFTADDGRVTAALAAAGRISYSPVKVTGVLETFVCGDTTAHCSAGSSPTAARPLLFSIRAAAIDTSDDATVNYDTLVFFNSSAATPIASGPFALPSTGPAYARAGGAAAKFFFEGSGLRIGTTFVVSTLAPDLSLVRFSRSTLSYIPRHASTLQAADDINSNVGFWVPQADFRIAQRLGTGFDPGTFPDAHELDAIYREQVRSFVAYQTGIALRALEQSNGADLVMIYIEQPDGSGHQFTLTDPRQASDPRDNRSVGTSGNPAGAIGQDPARLAALDQNLRFAYQQANTAVQAIIQAVGLDAQGRPKSNMFVVSDHGMAPFHTAVTLREVLRAGGMSDAELANLRLVTSGPAVNLYVNLAGREPGGTVSGSQYEILRDKAAAILSAAVDSNPFYNPAARPLFSDVVKRSSSCGSIGFCTDALIGQDSGDVFALLSEGYNFDGIQSPLVPRLQDHQTSALIYSVPNFYGAHGYNSELPSMSAILFAAGPDIKTLSAPLPVVHNIDIAPTIMQLLGVTPAPTVNGTALTNILLR